MVAAGHFTLLNSKRHVQGWDMPGLVPASARVQYKVKMLI